MASPIAWLAECGFKKDTSGNPLASGKVYFYAPGTTIQANVYSDADKTTILSQPITLDAQGRYSTVYTEGPVKMVAYDSTGVTVSSVERSNTRDATETEIHSAYFTGTKTDGTTGVSGRTYLDTVLTSIGSSLGGPDGKYLDPAGGTSRAVNVVVSEIGLSVKSMGAKGDGITVDTAAFNLAIAAIKAAGGKVLLIPPGTYLVDAALTVDFNGLHIMGLGEGVSIIKQTAAATGILSITGAYTYTVENVTLTASSSNTGTAIATVGKGSRIAKATITNFRTCIALTGAAQAVNVYDCYLEAPDNNATCIAMSGSSNQVAHRFVNNRIFNATANAGKGISLDGNVSDIEIIGNRFDALATGVYAAGTWGGIYIKLRGNYLEKCTKAWDVSSGSEFWVAHDNVLGILPTVTESNSITVASAGTVTLPGGDYYVISGNTTINYITTLGAYRGKKIVLEFTGAPTVTHNAGAVPANTAALLLAGAANFGATAADMLVLIYNGTNWKELSRAVI